MGYMGFGMRKEVYTRKPKEAFKKVKEMYGENPAKKTEYSVKPVQESTLIKVRQRIELQVKKSQMKAAIILSLSTLMGILLSVFWSDLIIWWFGL